MSACSQTANDVVSVIGILKFKPENRQEIVNFLANDETGLKLTRKYALSVECRYSMDDDETIYMWAKYPSEAVYEEYKNMRINSGFWGPWMNKMTAPPQFIRLSNESC